MKLDLDFPHGEEERCPPNTRSSSTIGEYCNLQATSYKLQTASYKLQTASYKLQQPIANSEPHRNTIANNKVESSTNYNHPHPSMVRRAHIPRIREENRCDAQALPT